MDEPAIRIDSLSKTYAGGKRARDEERDREEQPWRGHRHNWISTVILKNRGVRIVSGCSQGPPGTKTLL